MSSRLVRALLIGLLATASLPGALAAIPASERNALVALYNATDGASWFNNANWLGAPGTECLWDGVVCNGGETSVQELRLGYNNLVGTIPTEIGDLTNLYVLDLSGNVLTGSVPVEIGTLTSLQELSLYQNSLSGQIPDIFGNLQVLQILYLCCNGFTGGIPASITGLSQLQELNIGYNQLSGGIPAALGTLPALRTLSLENNRLGGGIPMELGDIAGLQSLDLSGNLLNGSIPSNLGSLTILQSLRLGGNQLSGSLPPELGNLAALRELQLEYNGGLSGTLPIELGNLSNLQILYLEANSFTQSIPSELGNLGALRELNLSANGFTGGVPQSFGGLANLRILNMCCNPGLGGGIPSSLGNLLLLQQLDLSGCALMGSIPPELGLLQSLQGLALYDNNLSGNIPTQLGSLANLRVLALEVNNLAGNIPTQLGSLTNLEELRLAANFNLTGPIPDLSNLTNLLVLSLSQNQFSGNIPTQLGSLVNLEQLDLGTNLFSGNIPTQLGSLVNLRWLDLGNNDLSGNIPTQLGSLVNLNILEMEVNSLSGNIPTQLGSLTKLTNLTLSGNALRGELPASMLNLQNLAVDGLDIGYNLLYTTDPAMRTFINSRQQGNDFEATQTVAPSSVGETGTTQTSIDLTWPAIRYSWDPGSYLAYWGTSPGQHPNLGAQTLDKTITTATIGGLETARTYYVIVETETLSHIYNNNDLVSDPSTELVVRTAGCYGLTPTTLPGGFVGDAYSQTVTPTGGSGPYVFTVDAGSLPAGLSLSSSTGTISGTFASAGVSQFTIRAEDSLGCAGAQDYTVIVSASIDHVVGQGLGSPNPNQVKVYDEAGAATTVDFLAYGAGRWGVNVAAGELDGGNEEIVTGPGPGDVFGPQVRAFVRDGTPMAKVNLFAYGTLKYGVNVGSGRIDGDVYSEILSGAGSGPVFGPHVRAWNVDGGTATAIAKVNFFAYGTLKFGVNVASGLVDGDAFAEILSAPGPGVIFGPQIRGFDFDGGSVTPIAKINFNAFNVLQYGAGHASDDVDGDGYGEIVVTPGPGPDARFPSTFKGFDYDGATIAAAPGYEETPFTTWYGGRVGLGDVDRDGAAELLAGAGRDPVADSTVQRFKYDLTDLLPMSGTFVPFGASTYGVSVAGGGLGY